MAAALPAAAWADTGDAGSVERKRIVGGAPAGPGDWPHAAALYRDLAGDGRYAPACGASLVRSDWVLTAAHCVFDDADRPLPASRIRLVIGRSRLSTNAGETFQAAAILRHPAYVPSDEAYDVALIKLAGTSSRSAIRVVGLSESALWAPGREAKVVGWGAQYYGGAASDDLREVDIHMVADSDCATSYRFTFGFDPQTMVCAGELTGLEDACEGDSGGPLMVRDTSGGWVLAGAVSFGLACGLPTQYGVYARLGGPALRNWVNLQIGV